MKLFRFFVRLRILVNFIVAAAHVWAPEFVLKVAGMAHVVPIGWVRYAGVQIALITLVYIPAAIRPERNRGSSLYACFVTIPLIVLFLWHGWYAFAIYDAVFVLILAMVYSRAVQADIMKHP